MQAANDEDSPKLQGATVRWLSTAAILSIPLLWWLLGYALSRTIFRTDPEPVRAMAELEGYRGITFPPGSSLVDGGICRSWAPFAFARVRVPRSRLDEFWKQPAFAGQPRTSKRGLDEEQRLPPQAGRQWHLTWIRDLRVVESRGDFDGGFIDAIVSLDDPANPLVHVNWRRD